MEFLLDLISKAPLFIGYATSIIGALITIALIIPGDQPEKFLQGALDFLAKFSKK